MWLGRWPRVSIQTKYITQLSQSHHLSLLLDLYEHKVFGVDSHKLMTKFVFYEFGLHVVVKALVKTLNFNNFPHFIFSLFFFSA